MQQITLFEESKWTPEKVYESFAGRLVKNMPFNTLGTSEQRFYKLTAERWNSSPHCSPPSEKGVPALNDPLPSRLVSGLKSE